MLSTHKEARMTDDPVLLAYCAGLFDGEGYITIRRWVQQRGKEGTEYRYRSMRYELQLGLNQVRPEAVFTIYQALGGRVWWNQRGDGRYAKYSGRWSWDVDSVKGVACLQALLPYLRIKRPEAEVAIAFQARKANANCWW